VANILGDADLRQIWQDELAEMRTRIHQMRKLFVEGLDARDLQIGNGLNQEFLDHHGMFSFTGLEPDQIEALRQQHSIYMLGSSRINFAGLTAETIPVVCDAIASVSIG
jgi:aspartate/tyrosine/aromatic aminotransferase